MYEIKCTKGIKLYKILLFLSDTYMNNSVIRQSMLSLRLCRAAYASTLACSIPASAAVAGPATSHIQMRISHSGHCGTPIVGILFPLPIYPRVPRARASCLHIHSALIVTSSFLNDEYS
jgi:hypothetical protein